MDALRIATLGLACGLLLLSVPAANAGPLPIPECPEGLDEGTCATYEHHRYCLQQKPPYLGDSWTCFANPMP